MIMCHFLASLGHLEHKLLPQLIFRAFIPTGPSDEPHGLVLSLL